MRAISRRLLKIGIAVLLVFGLLGVAATASVMWRLEHLKVERAPNDVTRAIAEGDLRLLAIEGQALFIPGVTDALYETATASHCGIRVIHVGDAFYWDWEEHLYYASFRYADAFNRQLVTRVPRDRLCDPVV